MKKFGIGCGIVGAILILIIVVVAMAGAGGYNRLVGLSQNVNKQWAQVQNNYQRRADLVPNLVNTVPARPISKNPLWWKSPKRGLRWARCRSTPTLRRPIRRNWRNSRQAQNQLGRRVVAFAGGVGALSGTAGQRQFPRFAGAIGRDGKSHQPWHAGTFNEAVQAYNTAIKSFPTVLYAGMLGFKEKPYFRPPQGGNAAQVAV